MHAILLMRSEGGSRWCFTVNLHDEKVEAAFKRKNASPVSYYQDRVQRQLKKFGRAVSWQCVEIRIKNLSDSNNPADAEFKATHHLHGSFHLSEEVDKADLRRALRLAAGELPLRSRNSQALLKSPIKGREFYWPRYYCRKQALDLVAVYGERTFSYSQELVRPARFLYEESRKALNRCRRVLSKS